MSKMEEKPNRKRINMKSHLCIPRLMRSNNTCTAAASSTPTTKRLSPMSLLERFREAVFRLIMLTALSKATHNDDAAATGSVVDTQRSYYPPSHHDPHHSEAVAECIEFIKKSASTTDENRDSTASSTTSNINDATTEVVIVPVPVM